MSENQKPAVILGHGQDDTKPVIKLRLVEWGLWPNYSIDVEGWDDSQKEWIVLCEFAPKGSSRYSEDNVDAYSLVGLKPVP